MYVLSGEWGKKICPGSENIRASKPTGKSYKGQYWGGSNTGNKGIFSYLKKRDVCSGPSRVFYENVCVQDAPVNKVHECECC